MGKTDNNITIISQGGIEEFKQWMTTVEEIDFMEDRSRGPEILLCVNPNFSGKRHIAIEVFCEKTGDELGHRTLCKDVRHKGTKRFQPGKLSDITCKHCLRKYNSGGKS